MAAAAAASSFGLFLVLAFLVPGSVYAFFIFIYFPDFLNAFFIPDPSGEDGSINFVEIIGIVVVLGLLLSSLCLAVELLIERRLIHKIRFRRRLLFQWNKVPNNEDEVQKLRKFLLEEFDIEDVERISKSPDDRKITIKTSKQEEEVVIRLSKDNREAILTINYHSIYRFIVKHDKERNVKNVHTGNTILHLTPTLTRSEIRNQSTYYLNQVYGQFIMHFNVGLGILLIWIVFVIIYRFEIADSFIHLFSADWVKLVIDPLSSTLPNGMSTDHWLTLYELFGGLILSIVNIYLSRSAFLRAAIQAERNAIEGGYRSLSKD
jgi:hypothetical protein